MPNKFITTDINNEINNDITCEIKRTDNKVTMTFTGFTNQDEAENFYNVQMLLWGAETLPEKLN